MNIILKKNSKKFRFSENEITNSVHLIMFFKQWNNEMFFFFEMLTPKKLGYSIIFEEIIEENKHFMYLPESTQWEKVCL